MVSQGTLEALAQAVDEHAEEAEAFLRELVRTPSVNPPGEYDPIRSVVEEQFASYGWATETVYAPEELLDELGLPAPRPNVLGGPTREDGGPGEGDAPTLGLVAHFDTVPADPTGWSHDPFGAEVVDGRLYGRGAKDCKARVAAYSLAVRALEAADRLPANLDLVVAATADEETGSAAGAKYLAESGAFRPEYAVLEGNVDRVWYATAGVRQFEVTIAGKSAHAGLDPESGANPIFGLERLLPALTAFDESLSELTVPIPGVTAPTCMPTMLDAGIKANVVPSACAVTVDLRVPPTVDGGNMEDRFRGVVADLALPDGLSASVERVHAIDAYVADSDGPLARTMQSNAAAVLGREVPMEGVMGPTDAMWFGAHGCECVHYGPGDADSNQHGEDENVSLEQVRQAATAIAASAVDLAESVDG